MRVWITGATGLLGRYLLASAPQEFSLTATWHDAKKVPPLVPGRDIQHEILDLEGVAAALLKNPADLVIHAASIGSVDYAAQHPGECQKVNVEGTRLILDACRDTGARMVFISSNAVYDGDHPPYSETAAQKPINYYGELKVEGERLTKTLGDMQMILRPILLFGWNAADQRDNPVTWQLNRMKKGLLTQVVDDKFSNPIYAGDCAAAIWQAIERGQWGESFNLGGPERLSRYEFSLRVNQVFGYPANLISPTPSNAFPELAPRPNDTTFDIKQMRTVLGVEPLSIIKALEWMRNRPTPPATGV